MQSNRTIFNCKINKTSIVEDTFTEEEILQEQSYEDTYKLQEEIRINKKYLADTDYIVIKMYEASMQGESIVPMLSEYKTILAKRKAAREKINELLQAP